MKTQTLEMIIEELTSALSLERWKNDMAQADIAKLKDKISELEEREKENG